MHARPGIDLVDVAEVAESIESFGERYLTRLHSEAELARSVGWPTARRAEHLAGRFAAKEAVVKALGVPGDRSFSWRQVEIVDSGRGPAVTLHGTVRDWAEQNGLDHVEVSITHDAGRAMAFAIAQSH